MSTAKKIRVRGFRGHRLGEPAPWHKRWFAEAEWRVRKGLRAYGARDVEAATVDGSSVVRGDPYNEH